MLKGFLYASAVTIIWSFLVIVLKYSTTLVSPPTTCTLRFFVATLLTASFLLTSKQRWSILKSIDRYMVLAGLLLGVNYVGFMWGVHYGNAVNAQLMIQSSTFIAFVFGVIFLKESCKKIQGLGLVVCMLGFFIFYLDQRVEDLSDNRSLILSNLWILISGTSWALYAIFQKMSIRRHPERSSMELNLVLYIVAGASLAPFVPLAELQQVVSSKSQLLLFFILGCITVLSYFCISQSLKHISTGQMACVLPLTPFLTILFIKGLSEVNLSPIPPEPVGFQSYFGIGLVVLGVVMIYMPSFVKSPNPSG